MRAFQRYAHASMHMHYAQRLGLSNVTAGMPGHIHIGPMPSPIVHVPIGDT